MDKLNGRSTCEQVVAACNADTVGESTVIVTGSNTGIGAEAAKQLAKTGAHVILACRSLDKAEMAKETMLSECPDIKVTCMKLDLSDLDSVYEFHQEFEKRAGEFPPLRYLVLNAGIFPTKLRLSKQDMEMTFATNHLGHYYLTKLFLPRLRENKPSRVVVVSSMSHQGPWVTKKVESKDEMMKKLVYPESKSFGLKAGVNVYGSSKLANVLFANELNALEKDNGVVACSLHPGAMIPTDIGRDAGNCFTWFHKKILSFFTKSINQGSATTVLCTVAPEEYVQGRYFSDCKPHKVSRLVTKNAQVALWELSEELLQKVNAKL